MWFGVDAATAIMKRGEKRVAASCEDIRRTRRRTGGIAKDATSRRHIPHEKTEE
jgi:hypothetical protein